MPARRGPGCRPARRSPGISGTEGSIRYCSKSVTPSPARNVSSMRKLPREAPRRLLKDQRCGVGQNLRRAARPHHRVAAEQILICAGRDGRSRPERVDGDALAPQLAREAQHAQAHAELGHRIGEVRREPFLLHVERRRQHQDVRVLGLFEMRDGVLRHHERAARVDLMHQVEALHVGLRRRREADGAGVVDDDVDAAEGLDRPLDGLLDDLLVAHVDDERQRLAAGLFDFLRRRVDGAPAASGAARRSWRR